jgi:hypothetical protein
MNHPHDKHHVESRDGFSAYLIQDVDCTSPRDYDGNLLTIVGWHDRRNIGDEQWRRSSNIGEQIKAIQARKDVVFFSFLSAHEHGDITIWLGRADEGPAGTNCQWDSGQVGIVYMTRESVRDAMGWKNLNVKRRAMLREQAVIEVQEYDRWLRGDCYGVVIEIGEAVDSDDADREHEGEEVDSCWGFIGHDYATEEAKRMLTDAIASAERKRLKDMEDHDDA